MKRLLPDGPRGPGDAGSGPMGESRARRRTRAILTVVGFLEVIGGSLLLRMHGAAVARGAEPGIGGVTGMALILAGVGCIVVVNHLLGWRGLPGLFSRGFAARATPGEEKELPGTLLTVGLLGAGFIGLFLLLGGTPTAYTGKGLARLLGMAVMGGVLLVLRARSRRR